MSILVSLLSQTQEFGFLLKYYLLIGSARLSETQVKTVIPKFALPHSCGRWKDPGGCEKKVGTQK